MVGENADQNIPIDDALAARPRLPLQSIVDEVHNRVFSVR